MFVTAVHNRIIESVCKEKQYTTKSGVTLREIRGRVIISSLQDPVNSRLLMN